MSLVMVSVLTGIVAMSSAVDVERPEDLSIDQAIKQGRFDGSVRYRYEDVNQERGETDLGAQASTLRAQINYETERFEFFSVGAGVNHLVTLTGSDNYFDGQNDERDDALVADAEGTFLNRYWLAYDIANTLVRYGQQPLTLDNGRFLGADNFRQNSSSVRGVTVRNESLNFLRLFAGHLYHFNSPLPEEAPGARRPVDVDYFNMEYRGIIHSKLSLYHYHIEARDMARSAWDTSTSGIRFAGDIDNEPGIEYAFEYARQKDAENNPGDYSTSYWLTELGVRYQGVRVHLGQEVLGGETEGYFVTPLAALHNFQGAADIFSSDGLGNIVGGLEDRYYTLSYTFDSVLTAEVQYHEYESNHSPTGLGKLGKEYNAAIFGSVWGIEWSLRYADYHARTFGQDTRKAWTEVSYSF